MLSGTSLGSGVLVVNTYSRSASSACPVVAEIPTVLPGRRQAYPAPMRRTRVQPSRISAQSAFRLYSSPGRSPSIVPGVAAAGLAGPLSTGIWSNIASTE